MSAEPTISVFYTSLQRRLHWLVIVLLLVQYALQAPMKEALGVIEQQETLSFDQFLVTTLHTWAGLAIGVIMLWRWTLRKREVPLNGGDISQSEARWVSIHHICLYVVTLLMVLSGAMHYYLGWPQAARWHEVGKWLLLSLIAIHVIGALRHVGSGKRVLHRMMGRDSLR